MMASLRISTVVCGRESDERLNRVTYFVDPTGIGPEKDFSENIVLARWRRRRLPGREFKGVRLSPSTWRAIDFAFPEGFDHLCHLDEAGLAHRKAQVQSKLAAANLDLPPADSRGALAVALGAKRMTEVVERQRVADAAGQFGTPDPFLYAKNTTTQKVVAAHFVEVKQPDEAISAGQLAMIQFLNDTGLSARVLRLIER